jgi:hypothetical protein
VTPSPAPVVACLPTNARRISASGDTWRLVDRASSRDTITVEFHLGHASQSLHFIGRPPVITSHDGASAVACADCDSVTDMTTAVDTVSGHSRRVEAGYSSGGLEHAKRAPFALVQIELGQDTTLSAAAVGTRASQLPKLLRIVRLIRIRSSSSADN